MLPANELLLGSAECPVFFYQVNWQTALTYNPSDKFQHYETSWTLHVPADKVPPLHLNTRLVLEMGENVRLYQQLIVHGWQLDEAENRRLYSVSSYASYTTSLTARRLRKLKHLLG